MGECTWSCGNDGCSDLSGSPGCRCSGSCLGLCSNACSGCTGDCTGDCSGGCSSNCANSCLGANCTGGCKNNCGKGCNTGCTNNEANTLYQALKAGLNKKIYAADMANINRMIEIEASANRFNKTITSVNFLSKNKANSSQVIQLQKNLAEIGRTISKNAGQKIKSWRETGQELVDQAKLSYETTITSSSTG